MRTYWLVLLLSGVILVPLNAQSQPAPVAMQGIALLEAGKCDSAFTLWSSTWVGTDDDRAKSTQLVESCALLAPLGDLLGHDVVRTVDISAHLQRIYLVMRYQRQPVFLMLLVYKPTNEWQVQTVNWHTDIDRVFPQQMYGLEHP